MQAMNLPEIHSKDHEGLKVRKKLKKTCAIDTTI